MKSEKHTVFLMEADGKIFSHIFLPKIEVKQLIMLSSKITISLKEIKILTRVESEQFDTYEFEAHPGLMLKVTSS